MRKDSTCQKATRKEFFKPAKGLDETGKRRGAPTTWLELALKGETESIWEYLHEDEPAAQYHLSDVRTPIPHS